MVASFILEISVTGWIVSVTIDPQTKYRALFLTSKSSCCAFELNLVENHEFLYDTVREGENVSGNEEAF